MEIKTNLAWEMFFHAYLKRMVPSNVILCIISLLSTGQDLVQ